MNHIYHLKIHRYPFTTIHSSYHKSWGAAERKLIELLNENMGLHLWVNEANWPDDIKYKALLLSSIPSRDGSIDSLSSATICKDDIPTVVIAEIKLDEEKE